MNRSGTVLMVGAGDSEGSLRTTLEALGARVVTVPADADVDETIRRERPDLLVADAEHQTLRAHCETGLWRASMAVVAIGSRAGGAGGPAVDDTVPPVPNPGIRERLHLALRLGLSRRAAGDLTEECRRLQEASRGSVNRLTALLLNLLEREHPGAVDRARQATDLSARVAARFEVPEVHLPGLEIAARLHDVGWILAPVEDRRGSSTAGWSHTVATRTLLEPFPELVEAASLIGSIHENWDGTGHPDHLLSGQIPLRSRILRAVIDYLDALAAEHPPTSSELIDLMAQHSSTLYDPLVIVHLRMALDAADGSVSGPGRMYLGVTELHQGMVLAEDLYTDGGIKLLARGTVLSEGALEIILRRHVQEPIAHGVAIQRRGGARPVR